MRAAEQTFADEVRFILSAPENETGLSQERAGELTGAIMLALRIHLRAAVGRRWPDVGALLTLLGADPPPVLSPTGYMPTDALLYLLRGERGAARMVVGQLLAEELPALAQAAEALARSARVRLRAAQEDAARQQ